MFALQFSKVLHRISPCKKMTFELFKRSTVCRALSLDLLGKRVSLLFDSVGGKPSKAFSSPLSNAIEGYQTVPKQMAPSVKSLNKIPPICLDPQFDAIATIDDDTYIFKGMSPSRRRMQGRRYRCDPLDNLVYRRTKMSMDTNYPKAIRDVFGRWEGGIWQTLPDKLDTALTWPNQQIFFFKVIERLAAATKGH